MSFINDGVMRVLVLLVVFGGWLSCVSTAASTNTSDHNNTDHHGEVHGIHVASVDFDHVRQPLIVTVFLIAVVICKIGFHKANFLSSWMPESCMLIILGTAVGGILQINLSDEQMSTFHINPSFFFLVLLPPCILEASYSLHDAVFFANIGTILLYAVLGTLLNCFAIAPLLYYLGVWGAMGSFTAGDPALPITLMQCFVFASLIVAVDPVAVLAIFQEVGVNNVLYFLVFGESLLNDAVTVVLYKTITTLNAMPGPIPYTEYLLGVAAFFTVSLGGLTIGLIFGILTAIITRFTQHVRVVEPLAIFSMAYCAYLMAELFHFSGIISMIGCGLIQKQYAFHNISTNSNTTIKYFTKMISAACDCVIFMFLGISLVRDDHEWDAGFICWSIILCLIIRMIFTYGLTFFANRVYRDRKINLQEQFIMGYGGLRGGVAFCLVAMLEPNEVGPKNMFLTATLCIILFTVFVQGMTIKPLVKCLRVQGGDDKVLSMLQEINQQVTDHMMVFMEEVCGHLGHNTIKTKMYDFDKKYMKRWLQREPMTKDEAIMEIYQHILMQQYYETLYGPKSPSSSFEILPAYNLVRKSYMDVEGATDHRASKKDIAARESHAAILNTYALAAIAALGRTAPSTPRKPYGRNMSLKSDEEEVELRNYATVPPPATQSRPSLFRMFSENRGPGDAEKGAAGERPKRKSILGRGNQGSDSDEAFNANPTAQDLRRMLIKTDRDNAYVRVGNKNLSNETETDLVTRLQETQLRHERMVRSRSIAFESNANSRRVSMAEDKTGLGEFENVSTPQIGEEQRKQSVAAFARHRHKTMDPTLSSDYTLQYKPKYVSKAKHEQPGTKRAHLESVKDEEEDKSQNNSNTGNKKQDPAELERLFNDTDTDNASEAHKTSRGQLHRQDANAER